MLARALNHYNVDDNIFANSPGNDQIVTTIQDLGLIHIGIYISFSRNETGLKTTAHLKEVINARFIRLKMFSKSN